MELSPSQILFFALPEGLLVSYVGLGLINIKVPIQKHIKITLICTSSLVILRNILKLYGAHVIILYLVLTLSFKILIRIKWKLAIIASLLGYILLSLGEALFLPLILQYLNTNIQELINNNLISVLPTFCLTKVPLLISSLMIYYFDFSFFKFNSGFSNTVGDKDEVGK